MKTRYTFGGDEHIYVEIDEEMSLDAFFKSLSMSNAVREAEIEGITEICPANASFQVKFNPDVIHPDDLLARIKTLEEKAIQAEKRLNTRIIEIPVYYQDPWTHETLMRFRERHQDPTGSDLEYAARINGFDSVDDFITAHHSSHGLYQWSDLYLVCLFFISWLNGKSSLRCQNISAQEQIRQS